MVEKRFSDTSLENMILTACFITDLGAVMALGALFANFPIRASSESDHPADKVCKNAHCGVLIVR